MIPSHFHRYHFYGFHPGDLIDLIARISLGEDLVEPDLHLFRDRRRFQHYQPMEFDSRMAWNCSAAFGSGDPARP